MTTWHRPLPWHCVHTQDCIVTQLYACLIWHTNGRQKLYLIVSLSYLIIQSVHTVEEKGETMQPPDLRQVTVLPKGEWLRIQGSLNQVNKYNESLKEASNQRETMHLRSKDVVKFWSNTIAVSRSLSFVYVCLFVFSRWLMSLYLRDTLYTYDTLIITNASLLYITIMLMCPEHMSYNKVK